MEENLRGGQGGGKKIFSFNKGELDKERGRETVHGVVNMQGERTINEGNK